MDRSRLQLVVTTLLAALLAVHLVLSLSTPATAYDAKVGSDSATVAVAASADGMRVYVCDGKRCYVSADGGATFRRLKVD
ncbi:MAG TPA: hypothetical protein VJV23_05930 [Candidatus Polarisedimenticolia bacterium]|nr:hypothetical protein [Candidatus Polarisedimenticolia bacterium]